MQFQVNRKMTESEYAITANMVHFSNMAWCHIEYETMHSLFKSAVGWASEKELNIQVKYWKFVVSRYAITV